MEFSQAFKENFALFEHCISLLCTLLTMYFNNNLNIQLLAFMAALEHAIKIFRFSLYHYSMETAPLPACIVQSFVNYFSHNCVICIACFIIFSLFAAMKYPIAFAKYHRKIRAIAYTVIILYVGGCVFISHYEILIKGYTDDEIKSRYNCPSAFRHRLYQYVLTTPIIDTPFALVAFYCNFYIVKNVLLKPKNEIKKHTTSREKISFRRWMKISIISVFIVLIVIVNSTIDISIGIRTENGIPEREKIKPVYFVNATSGVLVLICTVSINQVRSKFGWRKSSEMQSSTFSQNNSSINYSKNNSNFNLNAYNYNTYTLNGNRIYNNNNSMIINNLANPNPTVKFSTIRYNDELTNSNDYEKLMSKTRKNDNDSISNFNYSFKETKFNNDSDSDSDNTIAPIIHHKLNVNVRKPPVQIELSSPLSQISSPASAGHCSSIIYFNNIKQENSNSNNNSYNNNNTNNINYSNNYKNNNNNNNNYF